MPGLINHAGQVKGLKPEKRTVPGPSLQVGGLNTYQLHDYRNLIRKMASSTWLRDFRELNTRNYLFKLQPRYVIFLFYSLGAKLEFKYIESRSKICLLRSYEGAQLRSWPA